MPTASSKHLSIRSRVCVSEDIFERDILSGLAVAIGIRLQRKRISKMDFVCYADVALPLQVEKYFLSGDACHTLHAGHGSACARRAAQARVI